MCMLQSLRAYRCSFHEADFSAVEKFVLKAWKVPGDPLVLCPCLPSLSLVHVLSPCPCQDSKAAIQEWWQQQPQQ